MNNKIIGIILLCVGVPLLIYGINAMDSFSSTISEAFTGSPTDKALWLFISGIVMSVIGTIFVTKN